MVLKSTEEGFKGKSNTWFDGNNFSFKYIFVYRIKVQLGLVRIYEF